MSGQEQPASGEQEVTPTAKQRRVQSDGKRAAASTASALSLCANVLTAAFHILMSFIRLLSSR